MALKEYKPMTPGLRGRIDLRKDEITAQKPEKSLTTGKRTEQDAIQEAAFQFEAKAADINRNTDKSILSETNMVFRAL